MRYPEVVIDPSIVYTTKRGERYNIIENLGKQKQDYGKNITMVRIRFIDTGYEKDVMYTNAVHGKVSDPYFKDVLGIACKGELDTEFDQTIYNRWYGMLSRCYNKKDVNYNRYGAKGVTVCPEWLIFANFLRDFKNLPGYEQYASASMAERGSFHLDKDYLQLGVPTNQKVYSPSTCVIMHANKNFNLALNRVSVNSNFIKSYTGVKYIGEVYQAVYNDGNTETIIGYYVTDIAAANAYRYFCLDHNIPYDNELISSDILDRTVLPYYITNPRKEFLESLYQERMDTTLKENNITIGQHFTDKAGEEFEIIDISEPQRTTFLKAIATIRYLSTGYVTKVTTKAILNGLVNNNKLMPSVCGIGIIGTFERTWLSDKIYNMWYRLLQYLTTNYPDNPIAHIYEPWLIFTNFLKDVQYLEGYHKFFSAHVTYHQLGIYKNVMGIPKENWVFGPDVCYIAVNDEEDKCKFMYENENPMNALGVFDTGRSFKVAMMHPYTKQMIRNSFTNFDAAANMYNHLCNAFYGISPNILVPYMSYDECMKYKIEGHKKQFKSPYDVKPESEINREARCLSRYGMTFD